MDRIRARAIKLVVAFCALWLLLISGAVLAGGGCAARPDMSRLNNLPKACARPVLPLKVGFEVDTADLAPTVMYAGQAWSDAIGRPAFRTAGFNELPDVMIVNGPADPAHPDWDAETELRGDGGRCYKVITLVSVPADSVTEFFFYEHELGHALGLLDSPHEASVMFHWISPSLLGGGAGPDAEAPALPVIEATDVATLRAVY